MAAVAGQASFSLSRDRDFHVGRAPFYLLPDPSQLFPFSSSSFAIHSSIGHRFSLCRAVIARTFALHPRLSFLTNVRFRGLWFLRADDVGADKKRRAMSFAWQDGWVFVGSFYRSLSARQALWAEGGGGWRWLDAGYEWDFYAFMGNTMVRNMQNTRDEEARVKKG